MGVGEPGPGPPRRAAAPETEWMTLGHAAKYLGVSVWTIRKLVQEGKLLYTCNAENGWWRFDIRDLDRYVETSRRAG